MTALIDDEPHSQLPLKNATTELSNVYKKLLLITVPLMLAYALFVVQTDSILFLSLEMSIIGCLVFLGYASDANIFSPTSLQISLDKHITLIVGKTHYDQFFVFAEPSIALLKKDNDHHNSPLAIFTKQDNPTIWALLVHTTPHIPLKEGQVLRALQVEHRFNFAQIFIGFITVHPFFELLIP